MRLTSALWWQLKPATTGLAVHAELMPWVSGKTAAYVSEKGTCHLPATTPAQFSRKLKGVEKLDIKAP